MIQGGGEFIPPPIRSLTRLPNLDSLPLALTLQNPLVLRLAPVPRP